MFCLAFYWIEAKQTRINEGGIWDPKCSKQTRLLSFISLKVAIIFLKSFLAEVQKHFWFIAYNIFPYDCSSQVNTKCPFTVKGNKMTYLNCNASVFDCGGINCKITFIQPTKIIKLRWKQTLRLRCKYGTSIFNKFCFN